MENQLNSSASNPTENPYDAFSTAVPAPQQQQLPSNAYDGFSTPVAPSNPYLALATPVSRPQSSNPYAAIATPVRPPQANPYDAFSTPVQKPRMVSENPANFQPLPQGTEGSVPLAQAVKTAHMRAISQIQDIEEGRTFQRITTNPDGSAEYGYVYGPDGGRKVSPEEQRAIVAAHLAQVAGIGAGPQDANDPNGAKAAAARLQLQQGQSNNAVQNFAGAFNQNLANFGLTFAGEINPEAANRMKQNVNTAYAFDPDSKAAMAGNVSGMTAAMIPALLTRNPNTMAAVFASSALGGARQQVAEARASGQQITPEQELHFMLSKAATAFATGRITFGQIAGAAKAGGNALETAAQYINTAATGAADNMANQVNSNYVDAASGVSPDQSLLSGVSEAGLTGGIAAAGVHGVQHAIEPSRPSPKPVEHFDAPPTEAKAPVAEPVPTEQQAKEAEFQAEQQKAAAVTPKPSETKTPDSAHPPELADAKQVGEWYGKTFKDPANAQTIEALTSMHPGKYKLIDVPVDQIDPNAMLASDTNRGKVDAIKQMTPEERAKMPPVIAVGEGDKLSIADGSHRLTAAQEAGDKTIKAYVPEEFADDPSRLKRFVAGDTTPPEPTKSLTDSGAKIEYTDAAGKEQKGTYLSVSLKGDHWVRDANGKLDRIPTKDITLPPPKIPAEARSANGEGWSYSKLKSWAKENGYTKLDQAHNLNALRKAIVKQRNNAMIDLPQPPNSLRSASFKKMKYWAEQNGYDVSKIEGRRDLKEAIKFQRKAALAEARGKPLDASAMADHAKTIEAIKNARKSIQKAPPTGESTSHEPRAPKTFEELFTPLKSRIEDISKPVAGRVMRMEYDTMRTTADWINPLEKPGERLLADLGPKTGEKYTKFKVAMLNGDIEGAKALVPAALHPDVDAWFNSSKVAHAHMTEAGAKVGQIENHIGRELNDVKGLKEMIGNPDKGPIAEAWETARETLGKKTLTDAEKIDIANKVEQGFGPRKPGQTGPGFAKERNVVVTPENAKFYKDPFESQINYLKRAATYAEKTRFLGQGVKLEGRQDPNNKLRESIGATLKPEIESGRLTADKAGELHDLLHTLFTADSMKSSPAWKTTKDLIHAATLSQFRNAINQITDVAITAYDYGTGKALHGVKDALKLTPAEGRIIAKELGIEHGGYQFRGAGKIGQYVDAVTRKTGFQHLDIFGKENRLNGAYQWAQDAARNPNGADFKLMESRYKDMLGDRWDAAVADLKAGNKTADSQFIPFLELTRLQPVTKANMPEAYLKTAKGRVLYALKSFMLNQLDFVRRDVVRNLATAGQRRIGLQNMARLIATLSVANFGKDLMVDLIRGKRISAEQVPQRAVDSMLGIIGLSSFLVKKTVEGDPAGALMDFVGPPTPVINDIAHDVGIPFKKQGFKGLATVRTLPGIGDLLYFRTPLGRGYYMNQDEEKKEYTSKLAELRKEADEAEKSGDPSAKELIALYNHVKAVPPPAYVNSGVKPKPSMTVSSAHADNARAAAKIQIIKRKAVTSR